MQFIIGLEFGVDHAVLTLDLDAQACALCQPGPVLHLVLGHALELGVVVPGSRPELERISHCPCFADRVAVPQEGQHRGGIAALSRADDSDQVASNNIGKVVLDVPANDR